MLDCWFTFFLLKKWNDGRDGENERVQERGRTADTAHEAQGDFSSVW